jgi:threonine dehydrogenase-like Zn-dependent dehydrogenase
MDRLITHRFALDEIQTAFEVAMTGADGYIKGVITP